MYWSLYQFFPRTTFRTGVQSIRLTCLITAAISLLPQPSRVSLARARSFFRPLLPSACYAGLEWLGMIQRSKTRTCSDSRVSRLVNQSVITCIISDKLGSSWRLLPPNGSLYKAWSWHAFIIATFFSMMYQLSIFPNCNVFRIPQRDLLPIHADTFTLP